MQATFISHVPFSGNFYGRTQLSTRSTPRCTADPQQNVNKLVATTQKASIFVVAAYAAGTMILSTMDQHPFLIGPANAESAQAQLNDYRRQLKISGGSASTSGGSASTARAVTKTVTRGVTLENADFSNGNYEGVSFQQSILRQANFSNTVLRNASFFDADLAGAKFTNSDMTNVNLELASLRQADLSGANLTGAYISSTTKLQGVTIDDSDWSETLLRKDQQKYLCSIAKGTNPLTGVDTRESLFCPE